MADVTVDLELLRRQLAQAKAAERKDEVGHKGGGDGPHTPKMSDERIGRLEGAVEGLRHSQNMLAGLIALVAAFVIGFGIYTLQKIDTLDDKVNKLPGQISADIRDITKTLSEAITAAKQQAPQVIIMPSPQNLAPKSNTP
jgi:hypothetical protein